MTHSKDIVFMSIFYPQRKWHLLLREIRDILKRVQVAKHTEIVLVFLNHHRGANVRIVFEFNSDSREIILKKISALIRHFILYNQGRQQSVKLPITSFFADCPTNEVYYNLFNEHVLRYGAAGTIQGHLSEIIVHFFAGTHVNDETIVALIKYLHQYMLSAFLPNTKERQTFISCLRTNFPIINPEKTEHENLLKKNTAIVGLLEKFGKAAHGFFIETGDIESAYNEAMKIIELHLFKIPNQITPKTSTNTQYLIKN